MGTLGMQPRSQNKNQIFQSLSIQTNEYNPLTQKKKRKKKKERDFTSRSLPKAQICMPNRATPSCLLGLDRRAVEPARRSVQRMGVVDHWRGQLHLDSSRRLPLPHLTSPAPPDRGLVGAQVGVYVFNYL